jgi:hypothetical protein
MISILAALALATSANPAPATYLVSATISQDGKVLSRPRLTTKDGETAGIMIGDVTRNYALKVTPKRDAAQIAADDTVSLSLDLVVGNASQNRRVDTTVVAKLGKTVTLTLPATVAEPAVTVDVTANRF